MAKLAQLALEGHAQVVSDSELRESIRASKVSECKDHEQACRAIIEDEAQFTTNDMFFHWQVREACSFWR